jgi:hypothetical protein
MTPPPMASGIVKCRRTWPVRVSTAYKLPPMSPKNVTPPAAVGGPPTWSAIPAHWIRPSHPLNAHDITPQAIGTAVAKPAHLMEQSERAWQVARIQSDLDNRGYRGHATEPPSEARFRCFRLG